MTRHQSIQLARWWTAIADVQAGIDNELVPVGTHLGIEDHDLMQTLETLSEKIKSHFVRQRIAFRHFFSESMRNIDMCPEPVDDNVVRKPRRLIFRGSALLRGRYSGRNPRVNDDTLQELRELGC